MSKIDLSKANIGDKFRDRYGRLHELIYILKRDNTPQCLLVSEQKDDFGSYWLDGSYYKYEQSKLDLVEQVFDEPLDTKEIDIRTNHEMEKVVEVAKEEKQELQRRQEVVELADRIFFSERGNTYSFKECIEVAEHSVNVINQYLKEGKL